MHHRSAQPRCRHRDARFSERDRTPACGPEQVVDEVCGQVALLIDGERREHLVPGAAGPARRAKRAGQALVASWPYPESGYRTLIDAQSNIAETLLLLCEPLRRPLRDDLGITSSKQLQQRHQGPLRQRM